MFLIQGLVDDPASVVIEDQPGDGVQLLRVRVPPAEVGKIIGRQGRTIKAIRSLISAADRKNGSCTSVEIAEP